MDSGPGFGGPEIRDLVGLFPNTSYLHLDWATPDTAKHGYKLEPYRSGNHLQNLKSLLLTLKAERFTVDFEAQHAVETQMILDHLHMPALESINIEFQVTDGEWG